MNTELYRCPTFPSASPASPSLPQLRRRSLLASVAGWTPFHRRSRSLSSSSPKTFEISHPLPDPKVNYIVGYSGELTDVESHGGGSQSTERQRRARVVGSSPSRCQKPLPYLPIHHCSSSSHPPQSACNPIERLSLPAVVGASSTSPRSRRISHPIDKNAPPVPPIPSIYKCSPLPPLPSHANADAHHPFISAPLLFPAPPYRPPPAPPRHQLPYSQEELVLLSPFPHQASPASKVVKKKSRSKRRGGRAKRSEGEKRRVLEGKEAEAMRRGIDTSADDHDEPPFEFDAPEWRFDSSSSSSSGEFPSTPELEEDGGDEDERGLEESITLARLSSVENEGEEVVWFAKLGFEERCGWEDEGLGACLILDLYLD